MHVSYPSDNPFFAANDRQHVRCCMSCHDSKEADSMGGVNASLASLLTRFQKPDYE